VCNNAGYSSVKLSFDSFGKRTKENAVADGTSIVKPKLDIVKLGEALGAVGSSVETRDQLRKSLKSAFSSDQVVLLDVQIDPDQMGYEGSLGLNSAWT
jgi:thiamine pyrophosphate-dependent acetolactate synthase large subunit-like protein